MPTDDERSWVAKLLRSCDVFHADHFPHFPSYAINASVCGCLLAGVSEHAVRFAASYLADMVDPEPERTCKRVKVYSFRFPRSAWYMGCSICKHPLDVLDLHCRNCGARVVNDAD